MAAAFQGFGAATAISSTNAFDSKRLLISSRRSLSEPSLLFFLPPNSSSKQAMDAIRKQATRLREQVAKQQQAVLKQFAGGLEGSDSNISDEIPYNQHQKLGKLYISTRQGKHFQRDIVRGMEGYIVSGSKQVEIGTKLSKDRRKYGAENMSNAGCTLSKAALSFSRARAQIENERVNLLKALGTQVIDVSRRQAKVRELNGNSDNISKLENAEAKLQELKSNMVTLGGMDHLRVYPRFLHSNATSHKWALGAFAELLDNALDEVCNGATYVRADVLANKEDKIKMLLVEDNGGGMTPDKMRQCMSLGYSVKRKLTNTIGQCYGLW